MIGPRSTTARRAVRIPGAAAAVAALLLAACSGGNDGAVAVDEATLASHARMVELLAATAEDARENSSLLSDRELRKLRAQLAALPPDASPRTTLPIQLELAERELQLGNLQTGIEALSFYHRELERLRREGRVRDSAVVNAAYRLGIAYMRLGETQNCCLRNAPESCILPLRGNAIHRLEEGSRKAMEQFLHVLENSTEDSPLHLKARWLLNLGAMTLDEYPDGVPERYRIEAEVLASDEPLPRFANIAPALGLDTFNLAGGAVADDFDNDGTIDILTSSYDPTEPMRLFLNRGDGGFEDVSGAANLSRVLGGFNMVQADYDNDGDVDVLVLRGGWWAERGRFPNSLLRNDGRGRFHDATFAAGLGESRYPTQAASWADYDNDGDLDLYVGNETTSTFSAPCELWRNNGDGSFTDVAGEAGVRNRRFTKAVGWGDYDGDGDPDLYVSNLGQSNRLYRNEGDGTFTDVAPQLGVTGPQMSFPLWFWDFDNDGHLDLFVSSYDWADGNLVAVVASMLGLPFHHELARLYRADGRGGFRDVAAEMGLTRLTLPMAANFGDLDNDGWLDFYLGTGYPDYEALMPNVMYRNRGGGSFADVTWDGGFGHLQKGHGIAFADFDHDGDLDLFEQMGGFFVGDKYGDALFENPGFGHHWVAVRLEGRRTNRSAIGARIRVDVLEDGASRSIYRTVNSGGSFGANPLRQTIGLGRAASIELLEVRWPGDGGTQRFTNVPVDRLVEIVEGRASIEIAETVPFRLGGGHEIVEE